MIAASAPILTREINGTSVRFFRGPSDAPDMPWHVHDELLAALTLPRSLRRELRKTVLKHMQDACRTVELDGEPILIAPHFVAQGLIMMAQEIGSAVSIVPDRVWRDYNLAGAAALTALTAHLPKASERAAWAIQASRNQNEHRSI